MLNVAYSLVVSGVKMLPDCSVPFVGSDRIITVVYHRIALSVAIPRRALKSLKNRDFGVGFVVVRFFR